MTSFPPSGWQALRTTYERWWAGSLGRPIIPVVVTGQDPGRPCPDVPLLSQATCMNLDYTPAQLIDRVDYELSTRRYVRDSFPFFNMDCFGPGVAAAFLGARMGNRTGQVWFDTERAVPIRELRLSFQPDNFWLNRVKDIYRAAQRRWQGEVVLGLPDLGGVMDILATFLGSENLLLALYDEPEEVHRLVREVSALWHRLYGEFIGIIGPDARGFSDWLGVYSPKPSYVLQCDFAYMVSNPMFREFALAELSQSAARLHRAFFHLDGRGMLRHLDDILAIEHIHAIQWVPGDGSPRQDEWPEVYRKIAAAGKRTHLHHGLDCLRRIGRQTGTTTNIHHAPIFVSPAGEKTLLEQVDRLYVEVY